MAAPGVVTLCAYRGCVGSHIAYDLLARAAPAKRARGGFPFLNRAPISSPMAQLRPIATTVAAAPTTPTGLSASRLRRAGTARQAICTATPRATHTNNQALCAERAPRRREG